MTTRSLRLALANPPAGTEVVAYTTPPSTRTIVKNAVKVAQAAPSTHYIAIRSGPMFIYLATGSLTLNEVVVTDYWSLMEPGDELVVYAADNGCHFLLSGAELPLAT